MSDGQAWAYEENISLEQWKLEKVAAMRRTDPAYLGSAKNPSQISPSEELEAIEEQLRRWCDRHASEGEPFMAAVRFVDQARGKLRVAIDRLQNGGSWDE